MALAVGQPGFIFDATGRGSAPSYEELKRRRAMLDAIEARRAGNTPQNIGEGIKALGEGILGGFQERRLRKDEAAASAHSAELWKHLGSSASDPAIDAGAGFASMDGRYTAADIGKPSGPVAADPADADIYGSFIDTVKQGITNPYGLAAVAATGQRESGYSAGNAYRQWSDPSESGQAGQAGGIMSWRAERLANMRDFVAKNGGDPRRPSASLQAQFFLNEDPSLVERLNGAKSVEEAQQMMNRAWAFAGHDRPGGEAAARIATARSYLPRFTGGEGAAPQQAQRSVQVASNDPAAGIAEATQPSATNREALERAFAAQGAQRPPEMGAQDVAAIQARPRDPQAVPFEGPGATIDPRDVPALTRGNQISEAGSLDPESQALFDRNIRGAGAQPNPVPDQGPGAVIGDDRMMTGPGAPPQVAAASPAGRPRMMTGQEPDQPLQQQPSPMGGMMPTPTARPSTPQELAEAVRNRNHTVTTPQISSTPNVGTSAPQERSAFDLVAGPALGGNSGALDYAGDGSDNLDRRAVVQALQQRRQGGAPSQPQPEAETSPAVQRVAQAYGTAQDYQTMQGAPGGGQMAAAMRVLQDPFASPEQRQVAMTIYKGAQESAQLSQRQAYEASVKRAEYAREDARFAVTDRREDRRDAFDREKFAIEQGKPVVVNGKLVNPQTGAVLADLSDPNVTTVNGNVVDTNTGRVIYSAPEKPTTAMQEYDAYAADERAAGRQPIGRLQYEQALKKAGSQSTTINTGGNGSKFIEKSDEAASKRFDEIIQGGYQATEMLGNVQQLADLGAQIGTGKVAQVKAALGPYAEAVGLDIANLPEAEAYQSIVARMAPNMRPAGSGSSSDFDARQFLQGLPSLRNSPGGNEIITDTFQALAKNKMDAAEIASQAYLPPEQGGITWQEAEKRIRALPNPYERFKASRKIRSETAAPPSSAPAAADPSAQRFTPQGVPIGGGAQPPPVATAQRIRNPQTGQELELRGGAWVPVQ